MNFKELTEKAKNVDIKLNKIAQEKENCISEYNLIVESIEKDFSALMDEWKKFKTLLNINITLDNKSDEEADNSSNVHFAITTESIDEVFLSITTPRYSFTFTFILDFEKNEIHYLQNVYEKGMRRNIKAEELNYFKAVLIACKEDVTELMTDYCSLLVDALQYQEETKLEIERKKLETIYCMRKE